MASTFKVPVGQTETPKMVEIGSREGVRVVDFLRRTGHRFPDLSQLEEFRQLEEGSDAINAFMEKHGVKALEPIAQLSLQHHM